MGSEMCIRDSSSPIRGWQTTASDQMVEIWQSGFIGVPAALGSGYFAELNANEQATLFQVVQLNAAGPVGFSLAHRGRDGIDVMDLVVYDLGNATGWSEGQGVVVYSQRISDANTNWGYYGSANAFTATLGHYYAFTCASISSSGGYVNRGNLLDNVQFGNGLTIPAVPEPATYGLALGDLALVVVAVRRRAKRV